MKKIILAVSFCFSLLGIQAQELPVDFNEGVDLMAMVWRLTGDRTYNYNTVSDYCQAADEYFAPYKEHPVVAKAIECMETTGIGYDAVASYGLHLVISADGKLSYNQQFADNGDTSFDRWSNQQKEEFLPILEDFYHESNFHQWYVSTEAVRNEAITAFDEVANELDMQWFDKFFGPKPGNSQFRVVLSILCGVCNYGCSAKMKDGSEQLSPVISCCSADKEGNLFYYMDAVLPIVVHEFCHSYCNPLNAEYWDGMKDKAAEVFEINSEKLSAMAYPDAKIMMDETFVRSSVIRYQMSHGMNHLKDKLLIEPTKLGFLLASDMVEALGRYEEGDYASMNDFMPEIVKMVNTFDIEKTLQTMAEAARDNATYTCNIQDGATDIPSGESNLVIIFSKSMVPTIALGYGRGTGEFISLARGMESVSWDETNTIQTIELNLKPHTQYSFSILGDSYKTQDEHDAGETLFIDFTTGD